MRPLLSGRDYHALHHENPAFRFDAEVTGDRVVWRPYPGVPAIVARSNALYTHGPEWYRNFLYTEERDRGLDHVEDLASPGVFRWELGRGEAVWMLAAEGTEPARDVATLRAVERRRRQRFASRLHRSADAYLVAAWGREDDRRGLSLVLRLGPRHLHRAPRSLPRDRTPR